MIALVLAIGSLYLVGIVGYMIINIIDLINMSRYNREVRRAIRQINKKERQVTLTGTTTQAWVDMVKKKDKE